MKNLCVEKMELGPIATNAFLLWEENGNGEAVLIDAPPFARETAQQFLDREKLKLKGIWLTLSIGIIWVEWPTLIPVI